MITKAKIDQIRSLNDKKCRDELGLFVAEGKKSVGEFIDSDLGIVEIFSCDDEYVSWLSERLKDDPDIVIERISEKDMGRMSRLKSPPNVLAVMQIPRYEIDPFAVRISLSLALDDVQDPGNLGTIIRTCDWFGIRNIFCSPSSADCFNPKVVQSTMGALSRVMVHYTDLAELLPTFGIPIYGACMDGKDIFDKQVSARLHQSHAVIVMGNEGKGISREVENLVTERLSIPSSCSDNNRVESLNVAVATAIICAEFRKK